MVLVLLRKSVCAALQEQVSFSVLYPHGGDLRRMAGLIELDG
jgi:hypothetical protein